jgi:hypothetical protein
VTLADNPYLKRGEKFTDPVTRETYVVHAVHEHADGARFILLPGEVIVILKKLPPSETRP